MATFELFDTTESTPRQEEQAVRDLSYDFDEDTMLNSTDQNTTKGTNSAYDADFEGEIQYKDSSIRLYPQDPRTSIIQQQIVVLLLIFTTLGLNDQATGMLIPVLSSYYSISQVAVANIFLLQTFGYFCSCFVTEPLHVKYGVRGALAVGCLCIMLPSFLLYTKVSSFGVYLACYFPIGLGIGLLDSIVNCLFSSFICYKNELLGAVHGMYGVCSFLTPLIINGLSEENWNKFFIFQVVISGLGTVLCCYFFRFETKQKYEYLIKVDTQNEDDSEEENNLQMTTLEMVKKYPLVPLYTVALFFYLGSEVGTGSWIYTYLVEYKDGKKNLMSYITSSYWLGLTIGRFYFGMMIDKWFSNEYEAVKFFVKTTMLFTILLTIFSAWLSNSNAYFFIYGTIVFNCGMFIGPIFPLLSIVGADMLDNNVKVKGISTAISIGSIGGAFLPFLDGVFIKHLGLSSFPLLISASTMICLVSIFAYPYFIKNRSSYFFPQSSISNSAY